MDMSINTVLDPSGAKTDIPVTAHANNVDLTAIPEHHGGLTGGTRQDIKRLACQAKSSYEQGTRTLPRPRGVRGRIRGSVMDNIISTLLRRARCLRRAPGCNLATVTARHAPMPRAMSKLNLFLLHQKMADTRRG